MNPAILPRLLVCAVLVASAFAQETFPVAIRVDAAKPVGEMTLIWRDRHRESETPAPSRRAARP